jgi:hypothetical protein
MGIDLDFFNNLMKVEKSSGPFVECHYCQLHHQCTPEVRASGSRPLRLFLNANHYYRFIRRCV